MRKARRNERSNSPTWTAFLALSLIDAAWIIAFTRAAERLSLVVNPSPPLLPSSHSPKKRSGLSKSTSILLRPLYRPVAQDAALAECQSNTSLTDSPPGLALRTAWRGHLGELGNECLNLTTAQTLGFPGLGYRRGCRLGEGRLTRRRDSFWCDQGFEA